MDLEHIFREESGRILATLIGLLGNFDVAEEAMQEAFTVALEEWPKRGIPENPHLAGIHRPTQGDRFASARGQLRVQARGAAKDCRAGTEVFCGRC